MLTSLTSLTATAAGKAAAAAAGLTLAGGGLVIATDAIDNADAEAPLGDVSEQLEERDDTGEETLGVLQEELDTPENGNDDSDEAENEGRSEAVHDALTGEGDAKPGDGNEFGQQVAENARDGGVGDDVSEAARDGNGEEASAEGQSRNETGQDRADEARTQARTPSVDEETETASSDADDRADAGAGNSDHGKGQAGR